jgi:hypothetical protein
MAKAMQIFGFPLKTPTFAVGGQDTVTMEVLPDTVFGRIAHLAGFLIDVLVTPSFTTAPTIYGIHNMVKNLVFFDGANERLNLSGPNLRYSNIAEQGAQLVTDPDLNGGTGTAFAFRIPVFLGPLSAAGYPSDYIFPNAALKSAELRFNWPALTDISADCTALNNVNIRVTALVTVLDNQIRVPPAFERRSFNFGTTEAIIQGKALYHHLSIVKQSLGTAFSAGDLSEVTIDTGMGTAPSLISSTLQSIAQLNLRSGVLTQLRGEPRAATDDSEKIINLATPTAIAAADATLQAIISSPHDSRISKVLYEATSALRVRWSGSFATPQVIVSRTLEQPETAQAAIAAKAISALGKNVPSVSKIKTLDGSKYNGPRGLYLPRVFSW